MSNHSNSKFTFGNILLGMLALGTLIVSALIALLYFEVTRTPKRTASVAEDNNSQPVTKVEAMLPDGATVVRKVGVGGAASQAAASQSADPNRQQEADAAANALNNGLAPPPINTRALTSGQRVQRSKPRPKRPPREYNGEAQQARNSGERSSRNNANTGNSSSNGEIALEPVNVPPRERSVRPRRSERGDTASGGERSSRSRNSQSSGGERELTPVRPQSRPAQNNKQSEAIDALF